MSNKVLIISNTNELVRIKPERVVYVESDGNYSTMVLHDETEHVFTMNLAHCQQMMEEQLGKEAMTFIRIGKHGLIVLFLLFIFLMMGVAAKADAELDRPFVGTKEMIIK